MGSTYQAEAHLALARLHLADRQSDGELADGAAQSARNHLENLLERHPRSPWAIYARYAAGRLAQETGDAEGAETDLMYVVDKAPPGELKWRALMHAAEARAQCGRHDRAAAAYRRCRELGAPDSKRPTLLLREARQLELAGAPRAEVEQCYLRVHSMYGKTTHARTADYQRARLARDAGDRAAAVERYEFFLASWDMTTAEGRRAAADLVRCYLDTGESLRAVLLGDIMRARIGKSAEFRECLPALLSASAEAGLEDVALAMVEAAVRGASPAERHSLHMDKARFLIRVGRNEEAAEVLRELEKSARTAADRYRAVVLRATMLLGSEQEDPGVGLCRMVATAEDCPQEVRADALRVLGAHYEKTGRYEEAALAYSGKCPIPAEGTNQ
jgi:tetratricopeptide (TPR) repeat protein